MPYVNINTAGSVSQEQEALLNQGLSEAMLLFSERARDLLMVRVEERCRMRFRGKTDQVVYVRIAKLGKSTAFTYAKITEAVTYHVCTVFGVPSEQVFVQYQEADHWGWGGKNL